MYCVSVGIDCADLWEDEFADSSCVLLAKDTHNVKKQAQAFVEWCLDMRIDFVMGINSEAILSAIPHLPKSIRVVSRCANSFDHGYRITLSGKERLQAIIALTPRMQSDLINNYHVNPQIVRLIANGINSSDFDNISRKEKGSDEPLKLAFLGRLEHNQKGVMHLPDLVRFLNIFKVPFNLSIVGKGVDRLRLEESLAPWKKQGQISFLGSLKGSQIPEFLSKKDIFIFPSHFEGCPNALLEAMMAGCVSLSWRLKGITDYILKDGETGFLHNVGNCEHMALSVKRLNEDRLLLKKISERAARDARIRFTSLETAKAYASIFHNIMKEPVPDYTPKPWKKFQPDLNFKQKGDPWLPRGIKKKLKLIITNRYNLIPW